MLSQEIKSLILFVSLLGFYILSNLIKHVFRVPHEDPSGQSIVLPRYEFHRIVQSAQVLTKEQRMAQLEQMKRQKEAKLQLYHTINNTVWPCVEVEWNNDYRYTSK
jgi:hypothetical protein